VKFRSEERRERLVTFFLNIINFFIITSHSVKVFVEFANVHLKNDRKRNENHCFHYIPDVHGFFPDIELVVMGL